MKAEGLKVIGLGAGEPDFPTCDAAINAGIKAIENGDTKYTPTGGTKALIDAIIAKFKRDNNINYGPKNIIACAGGKQVLYNAIMATVDAYDEVIIPAPYWVSYPSMVELSDGIPVIIECPEENDFKLKAEYIEKAITKKTKWVIINSPSNPTGAALSEKELKNIADMLLKYPDIMIISDDIYEHIVFDGFKFKNIIEIEPKLKDRTLIVNGVSKSYSMTGWRLGYGAGPEFLIEAMNNIQSHSTSNPSSISQAAAVGALNGDNSIFDGYRKLFQRRRDLVVKLLNEIPNISCKTPEGAFYVFPSCKGLYGKKTPKGQILKNCTDVSSFLLEEGLVAVVPGIAFGLEGYFRISYATSDDILIEAINNIKRAISQLS